MFYGKFGVVSLFNGISTFMGNLMPKPSLQKNRRFYLNQNWGKDKGFMPFSWLLAESERNNAIYYDVH